ncbi:hypothetical protein PIB30_063913 [Stylosanthes scabra]|uniref:Uncharacterized protein n=1 Tax=Stylosanthes scabra TaxID=79078 RepID=A0ABU6UKF0_9FABA|nr:hypothetical protein [Stylosanthes scabra]
MINVDLGHAGPISGTVAPRARKVGGSDFLSYRLSWFTFLRTDVPRRFAFEESFHDFKGRYFKVFAVGDHPPFWLTLERDAGRFPSYWSKDAGVNYSPVTYRKLNDEQRDTVDILLWLFSKRSLKSKAVLGNPERARDAIVNMAGKNKTLARLRQVMQANLQGGASSNVGGGIGVQLEVSSPVREEGQRVHVEAHPPSPSRKRGPEEGTSGQKRPRVSEGVQRDFCSMDRSFDVSGFIESNLLGPAAPDALRDYDPMESLRWAQWSLLRSATIMKSIEPRLTVADQWEHRCAKLTGDLKLLTQQKAEAEKERNEVDLAKSKAEKALESALAQIKEKEAELQRQKDREAELLADLEVAGKGLSEEKSRAEKAEACWSPRNRLARS